jgi:hypothetical protein
VDACCFVRAKRDGGERRHAWVLGQGTGWVRCSSGGAGLGVPRKRQWEGLVVLRCAGRDIFWEVATDGVKSRKDGRNGACGLSPYGVTRSAAARVKRTYCPDYRIGRSIRSGSAELMRARVSSRLGVLALERTIARDGSNTGTNSESPRSYTVSVYL